MGELGLTEWRLANGARVLIKPTDFKEDQVLFAAFSPGGDSLVADRDYVSAVTAATIVDESGLDGFDAVQLRKKLAGRAVEVSPWIGELFEGFSGQARPDDLEVLLQLVNLYFTSPRRDEQAYRAYRERVLTAVRNRQASPEAVFQDRVEEVLSQSHFRRRPWSPALVEEMTLDSALSVYGERFRDAGDFTFLFVGNVTPEALEPLVASYLGTLPGSGRPESWRDVGIRPPPGVVQSTVRKGLEPKSRVEMLFHGRFPWSLENRLRFDALGQVLDIELREAVREEAGGSYDVGAGAQVTRYPREEFLLFAGFGCAPAEVERLTRHRAGQGAPARDPRAQAGGRHQGPRGAAPPLRDGHQDQRVLAAEPAVPGHERRAGAGRPGLRALGGGPERGVPARAGGGGRAAGRVPARRAPARVMIRFKERASRGPGRPAPSLGVQRSGRARRRAGPAERGSRRWRTPRAASWPGAGTPRPA